METEDKNWSIRIVPNKYPAVSPNAEYCGENSNLFRCLNGLGIHEVIVETSEHDLAMQHYNLNKMTDVLLVYKRRISKIRQNDKLKYVIIFKNQGFNAGATISHSHTQLITLPVVPLNITEELSASKQHYSLHQTCIYCHLIDKEQNELNRIITESDDFISVAAYASRFPYEVWIMPKIHGAHFENTTDNDIKAFAKIFSETLIRLDKTIPDFSYNFVIHSSPFKENAERYYHWHMEIIPRISNIAGFEWGTGYYINSVPPELAAQTLRNISLS